MSGIGLHLSDVWLGLAAGLAGFVDAIVGGGGLILLPALFAAFPQAVPASLLGTNKAGAIWGTGAAFLSYARRVHIPWKTVLPTALASLTGAVLGADLVSSINDDAFRKALPLVLTVVFLYTLLHRQMGQLHRPRFSQRTAIILGTVSGLSIGFYDGFLGPGTGSFLVFVFILVFGFDFLHAGASAKIVNFSSNLAALTLFASKSLVFWHLALFLAICNMLGSLMGTRMAMTHGTVFVRRLFIVVVLLLIGKTAWDAFGG
ncbi:TSUP family transporter [Acidithiobacillus sp. M4-SHS-6]|uniref:TSUP family transporter n=1 Tax=Acidithiobacillus sp. M4-SHS-6 TaxID=3383024 RepID=UPI0039BDDA20